MRILIAIQSCGHDPYLKNSIYMVKSYKHIINAYDLPIRCFYFKGNGTENSYFDGDEASIAYNDRMVSLKQFNMMHLVETAISDFDIIVQTNSSTVLNILNLYKFLTEEYDENYLWCGGIVEHWTYNVMYPNGHIYIYSKRIFDILYKNWQYYSSEIENKYGISINSNTNEDELMWDGIAEDFVIGYILSKNHIDMKKIKNILNMRPTLYDNIDYMKPNIYDYMAIYAKTHRTNIKSRQEIEPNIIEFLLLLFERHACCLKI